MKQLLAAVAIANILLFAAVATAQNKFFDANDASPSQSSDLPQMPMDSATSPQISLQPVYADAADDSSPSPDIAPNIHPSALASTQASSRPEAESAHQGQFPAPGSTFGLQEFIGHFAPYEPIYYIGGTQSPNVKFQISLRYRMFPPNGPLTQKYDWLRGFNAAMTLTAVQDLHAASVPIVDVDYKPELFYYWENIPNNILPPDSQLGLVFGIGHESNGAAGSSSRELNMVYLRPIIDIPIGSHGWFVTFAPKIYYYIGGIAGNTDIARYRGYADLRVVIGQRDGLQLETIGRIGSHFDRGSAELDLSYPLTKILDGNHDVSLFMQYFTGYGDDLLTYNKKISIVRFGFSLVR